METCSFSVWKHVFCDFVQNYLLLFPDNNSILNTLIGVLLFTTLWGFLNYAALNELAEWQFVISRVNSLGFLQIRPGLPGWKRWFLQLQHVRYPYRERHGSCLRKSVQRFFLWNGCCIGMCAGTYCSSRMGGVFAWENHGVPLSIRVFYLRSLYWVSPQKKWYLSINSIFCTACWKDNYFVLYNRAVYQHNNRIIVLTNHIENTFEWQTNFFQKGATMKRKQFLATACVTGLAAASMQVGHIRRCLLTKPCPESQI